MKKAGRIKSVAGSVRPGWFGAAAAVLVLVALAGAFGAYDGLSKTTPNLATGYGGVGAAVLAIVAVVLLALATRRHVRLDVKSMEMRRGFGKAVLIRWSEPHDFYYRAFTGASTPSVDKATVRTPDGRRIDVDDLKLPDHPNASLPTLAEQYSTAAKLPSIEERLEAGEEVEFGPVRLTSEQMHIGGKSHSLERGVVLQIEKGCLKVGTEGKWITTDVPVREVANYPCLLRAIKQVTHSLAPS